MSNYFPDLNVTFSFAPSIGGWSTLTKTARNGSTQKKANLTAGRRTYLVPIEMLAPADFQTLEDFYDSMQGAATRFYWFNNKRSSRSGVSVGTGNGSTTVFNLPFKDAAATPVFHWTGGGTATWTPSSATTGEDQVTFSVAPTTATPITVDFLTARERLQVCFVEDSIKATPIFRDNAIWYQASFTLKEDF
jgi:hypothetical protein